MNKIHNSDLSPDLVTSYAVK